MTGRLSRRTLLGAASAAGGMAALTPSAALAGGHAASEIAGLLQSPSDDDAAARGAQRLSLEKLRAWEKLGYGMFIHFGMSTFDGAELSSGDAPSARYAPDRLDVDQWVSVARDAGMKYAVLTTKHVAGHCLWPTKQTDYSVATSGNRTDVVEAFVRACERRGVMPGFYYCSWDNHNRFGSVTPSDGKAFEGKYDAWYMRAYTTRAYQDFQMRQVEELLTQYDRIGEVWIDIPGVLPRGFRNRLYNRIAELQPDTVMMANSGVSDGSTYNISYAWPSDLIAIERFLPNSHTGHVPWREIENQRYYMPGEVCDPIGKEWFFVDGDAPRSDAELLGMYLTARSRGTNLLLDVPPDRHGLIPAASVAALMRLRKNIDRLGMTL